MGNAHPEVLITFILLNFLQGGIHNPPEQCGRRGRCHVLHRIPENSLSWEMLGLGLLTQTRTIPLCSESRNQSTVWGPWHTETCRSCCLGWCYQSETSRPPFLFCYRYQGSEGAACWLWSWFMPSRKRKCSAAQNSNKQFRSRGGFLIKQSVLCVHPPRRIWDRSVGHRSSPWKSGLFRGVPPPESMWMSSINTTADQDHRGTAILRNHPVDL